MTNKRLSRRDLLKASALAVAGLAVASCTPATPTPEAKKVEPTPTQVSKEIQPTETPKAQAPAKQGQKFSYWVFWGHVGPVFDRMMKSPVFQEMLPGYTIDYKVGVGAEDLTAALASGTGPDGFNQYPFTPWVFKKVFRPLDDLMATSTVIAKNKPDYPDALWKGGNFMGQQWGVPAWDNFVSMGFWINTRMVKEAGLDPNNPPATWDDLFEWHKKLTKFDSAGNMTQLGIDPYDSMAGLWQFPCVLNNKKCTDDAGKKYNLNTPYYIEHVKRANEFVKLAGVDNIAAMRSVEGNGAWGGSYYTQKQAMVIDGPWAAGRIFNAAPEVSKASIATWVPVIASRKVRKLTTVSGHYVMISKDAKNLEGVWKFAEYWTTDEALTINYEEVGSPVFKNSWIKTIDQNKFPGSKFFFDSVPNAEEVWEGSYDAGPIDAFVSDTYWQLKEKVYRDQMKAEDMMVEWQKRVDSEMAASGFA